MKRFIFAILVAVCMTTSCRTICRNNNEEEPTLVELPVPTIDEDVFAHPKLSPEDVGLVWNDETNGYEYIEDYLL